MPFILGIIRFGPMFFLAPICSMVFCMSMVVHTMDFLRTSPQALPPLFLSVRPQCCLLPVFRKIGPTMFIGMETYANSLSIKKNFRSLP